MVSKDFVVHPKALSAVADQVDALLAEINGQSGYVAGNSKEFAAAADIGGPLATFWGTRENVFAAAYQDAHGAITTTFGAIEQQLQNLSSAARSTASGYHKQDSTSSHQVKQTLPGDIS
jgi:ABC-type transporter Mla subunit MlaD